MYRASDREDRSDALDDLERAADDLGLDGTARSRAVDLFLSNAPDDDRSVAPVVATSLYVGALVSGQERSQTAVADAVGVSRLSVQQRWKEMMDGAGLQAPDW